MRRQNGIESVCYLANKRVDNNNNNGSLCIRDAYHIFTAEMMKRSKRDAAVVRLIYGGVCSKCLDRCLIFSGNVNEEMKLRNGMEMKKRTKAKSN